MGIQPDIIVCRSEHPLDQKVSKIRLLSSVTYQTVMYYKIWMWNIYMKLRLQWKKSISAQVTCKCLNLECPTPDLTDWKDMVNALRHPNKEVDIALVGKYIQLHDAYISVVEALKHGGIAERATVNINWVDSEDCHKKMWTRY